MKHNTLTLLYKFFLSIFLLAAIGCHSNRKKLSEDGKKWKLIVSEYNGSIDKEELVLDFDEDGDFTLTSENKVSRGKYQTKGSDSVKLKMNDKEEIFRAAYHYVENKLKLDGMVGKKDTLYWELIEVK